MNPYATHQEYLGKELDNLKDGSIVLELGVGYGSSPLMYEFCKKNSNSLVYSFETNLEWFDKMFDVYGDLPNYIFNSIYNWQDLEKYVTEKKYDLTFVDQSPWMSRIESIDFLKDKCNLFILHDYDFFNKDENDWVKKHCNNIYTNDDTTWLGQKYMKEFLMEDNYQILPPTLVMRKYE